MTQEEFEAEARQRQATAMKEQYESAKKQREAMDKLMSFVTDELMPQVKSALKAREDRDERETKAMERLASAAERYVSTHS